MIKATVWKLQNLPITQILREINFQEFRSAKSAILPHLETLNFDFYAFLHFLMVEIHQISKIQSLTNSKNIRFITSRLSKIDYK